MPSFTVYKGAKDGKVYKSTTEKGSLENDQVLLRITASGLCGTDLHYRTTDMALGHEGVGIVEELGPSVTHLKKGDRVGWGYQHNSCGHCQECLKGTETYCKERAMYAGADKDQGSFASHAVWKEAFLFKIPDEISDEAAAPLMVSCDAEGFWARLVLIRLLVRWCYCFQRSACVQCAAN